MFGFFKAGGPRRPFPMADFENLRTLVLLSVIERSDNAGITGYELKSLFDLPQTTVYRALNDLESKCLVRSEEKVVDGRNQKRFIISEGGIDSLADLRKSVGGRIAFLFEMISPATGDNRVPDGSSPMLEGFLPVIRNRLRDAENRDDLVAHLDVFISITENQAGVMERMSGGLRAFAAGLEELRKKANRLEDDTTGAIKDLVDGHFDAGRQED